MTLAQAHFGPVCGARTDGPLSRYADRMEPVVPFAAGSRAAVVPATHIRSTVICSSLRAIRGRGLFDRYLAELEPARRDDVLSLTAGLWLPVEFGLAHYHACARLKLDEAQIEEMGGEVGRHINGTILSVAVKMSREAGVSPWSVITRVHKFRAVTWQGSDIAAWKLGPKEARLEWAGQPCAVSSYFGLGFGGYVRALCGLFCQKVYVRLLPSQGTSTLLYRISWV